MVNYGVSKACDNCKQRHKKCDETRPICQRCSRSRKQCTYAQETQDELIFRHFSTATTPPSKGVTRPNRSPVKANHHSSFSSPDSSSVSAADDEATSIAQRFIEDFCIFPVDRSISRGYLDGLPTLLERSDPDSDLRQAVQTLSFANSGMRYHRTDFLIEAERRYAILLRSFRKTIATIRTSATVETFVTSVLLGLYELITATHKSPSSHDAHLQGLTAILSAAGSPFDLLAGVRIFSMANALPVRISIQDHNSSALSVVYKPFTNVYVQTLDIVMERLNPILGRARDCLSPEFDDAEQLNSYFNDLSEVERDLSAWEYTQAPEWLPLSHVIKTPKTCCGGRLELLEGQPIETFYDLYVSSVWNTYRKCHILVLDMQQKCARKLQDIFAGTAKTSSEQQELWRKKANDLAMKLLSTVPFHLTALNTLGLAEGADAEIIESKMQDPSRPVGGLLMMHPLLVLARMSIVDENLSSVAKRTLGWIGPEFGIGEATVLADGLLHIPFMYSAKGHVLIWAGSSVETIILSLALEIRRLACQKATRLQTSKISSSQSTAPLLPYHNDGYHNLHQSPMEKSFVDFSDDGSGLVDCIASTQGIDFIDTNRRDHQVPIFGSTCAPDDDHITHKQTTLQVSPLVGTKSREHTHTDTYTNGRKSLYPVRNFLPIAIGYKRGKCILPPPFPCIDLSGYSESSSTTLSTQAPETWMICPSSSPLLPTEVETSLITDQNAVHNPECHRQGVLTHIQPQDCGVSLQKSRHCAYRPKNTIAQNGASESKTSRNVDDVIDQWLKRVHAAASKMDRTARSPLEQHDSVRATGESFITDAVRSVSSRVSQVHRVSKSEDAFLSTSTASTLGVLADLKAVSCWDPLSQRRHADLQYTAELSTPSANNVPATTAPAHSDASNRDISNPANYHWFNSFFDTKQYPSQFALDTILEDQVQHVPWIRGPDWDVSGRKPPSMSPKQHTKQHFESSISLPLPSSTLFGLNMQCSPTPDDCIEGPSIQYIQDYFRADNMRFFSKDKSDSSRGYQSSLSSCIVERARAFGTMPRSNPTLSRSERISKFQLMAGFRETGKRASTGLGHRAGSQETAEEAAEPMKTESSEACDEIIDDDIKDIIDFYRTVGQNTSEPTVRDRQTTRRTLEKRIARKIFKKSSDWKDKEKISRFLAESRALYSHSTTEKK